MTPSLDNIAELTQSVAALYDGELTTDQARRLETLLAQSPAARRRYAQLTAFFLNLQFQCALLPPMAGSELDGNPNDPPHGTIRPASPWLALLGNTLPGTINYFSQGMPLAYLLATVVTALGLLIGSLIHISSPEQVAKNFQPTTTAVEPKAEFVGRITGMVDCKWNGGSRVSLGQKCELASGLMEITYSTGAKVILQGPVTYEVESNGGYLAVGKLTGKLEKRGEGPAARGEKSVLSPSFILHPSSFVIRTPTATVTDLGTEFGVEVTKDQQNTVHVFQGRVVLRTAASSTGVPREIEMSAGESAAVDVQGTVTRCSGPQAQTALKAIGFVRTIRTRVIKTLDLVDVVAGGNGFGSARDRGIDPTTGQTTATQPDVKHISMLGDGRYHRAQGLPLVDGVFIPCGGQEPFQLDSAGHTFAGFRKTDNCSWGCIWAGGIWPAYGADQGCGIISAWLRGVDYSASCHSLLGMFANKGITFDLDAIRRAHPQCKIERFSAVAGSTYRPEPSEDAGLGKFDVWVFVDGQLRFGRERVTARGGWNALKINVELDDRSRFLSLAVSDGGDTFQHDYVIFGDPRLLATQTLIEGQQPIKQSK